MRIDAQKLDMQLAAQCLNLRDLRGSASPQEMLDANRLIFGRQECAGSQL